MLIHDTVFPAQPAAPQPPEAKSLPVGLNPEIIKPLLECTQCKGNGYNLSKGFTTDEGKKYPSKWKECYCCNGSGWYHAPDFAELFPLIKGRKPGTLRSKRPDNVRAYYIWRLARFHGGRDTCLPMCAEMDVSGDPYKEVLDFYAQIVAQRFFGSANVGKARWQQAFYGSHDFADLPQHIDGPVFDQDKPLTEYIETI